MTKTGTASALPGQPVSYTITVTNNGPSTATGVTVADAPGSGLAITAITGATCTTAGCTLGTLNPSDSVTLTVSGSVDPAFTGASVSDTATVSGDVTDSTPGNNSATATTSVGAPSTDLAVTKTGPATVAPGGTLSYPVTVTNNGPSTATGVVLTDTPGSGVLGATATGCSGTPLTCTIGTLVPGATRQFTVTATADPSLLAGATLTNAVSVTAATTDPVPANNSATASSTATTPSADLAVTKTAPDTITPGVAYDYTVTVTNNGPSNAAGTVLSDTLPAGVTFVGSAGATCTAAVELPAGYRAGRRHRHGHGHRAAGPDAHRGYRADQRRHRIVHGGRSGAGQQHHHRRRHDGPGGGAGDDRQGRASHHGRRPGRDLHHHGDQRRPIPRTRRTRRRRARPQPTFVSSSPAVCSAIGQTVTCLLSDVAVGSTPILLTVHVAADVPAGTRIDNAASASTPSDPDGVPPLPATPGPPVQTSADLSVTKTAPATVTAGVAFDYTVSVSNAGPSDAQAVTLTDTLPAGVTLAGATGANCSGAPVTCAVGTVPAGGLATVTLHVTPGPGAGGRLVLDNTVAVASGTTDPDTTNNTASATSTVGQPGRRTPRQDRTGHRGTGTQASYTLTVTNDGPSDTTGVTVNGAPCRWESRSCPAAPPAVPRRSAARSVPWPPGPRRPSRSPWPSPAVWPPVPS